jgi:4-aminobutyrate aminotransferase-like enzyme
VSSREAASRALIDVINRFAAGGPRRIAQSTDLVIDRGSGSYLIATDGSRYLDLVSGFGVASLGHCHPEWVKAVVSQAERLSSTPMYTGELAHYLSAFAAALPERLDQTALFSGGAEAVEVAIRLAQTATGRSGILTFGGAFHGKTVGVRYVGSLETDEARHLAPDWLTEREFPYCELHDPLTYSECEESASDLINAPCEDERSQPIAAVLVEPILGTAGNIPPRRKLLRELRRMCDQHGSLLILDESITGFGRTGSLFAFEQFGVQPDILVSGKGLGGGFPVSAVSSSRELWNSSSFAVASATSSSYGGNPLACAAAMATLDIVDDPEFLGEVCRVASHAAHRLVDLAARSPRVARPRGVGLMLGFDLVDPATGALADTETCAAVFRACRRRRVLLLADVPRVRLTPPLTFTVAEADRLFDVLCAVLT